MHGSSLFLVIFWLFLTCIDVIVPVSHVTRMAIDTWIDLDWFNNKSVWKYFVV